MQGGAGCATFSTRGTSASPASGGVPCGAPLELERAQEEEEEAAGWGSPRCPQRRLELSGAGRAGTRRVKRWGLRFICITYAALKRATGTPSLAASSSL
ncbi:unnamed protein product [Lampetra planeri]